MCDVCGWDLKIQIEQGDYGCLHNFLHLYPPTVVQLHLHLRPWLYLSLSAYVSEIYIRTQTHTPIHSYTYVYMHIYVICMCVYKVMEVELWTGKKKKVQPKG